MADSATIKQLRLMIAEPDETTYSNSSLSTRIDAALGDLSIVAGAIWQEKAASYAGLTNVKEGNSQRDLGALYKNALAMAASFGAAPTSATASGKIYAKTRSIDRV